MMHLHLQSAIKLKKFYTQRVQKKIDAARPLVGAELFGDEVPEVEDETEVTNELETEVEPQEEEEPNDRLLIKGAEINSTK